MQIYLSLSPHFLQNHHKIEGENASGNLKKHEKICQKLNFCQYCAKQFKFNYLVIRHEKKGCRPVGIDLVE
jgi:hypothetical protein